jgi:hypothetical protein
MNNILESTNFKCGIDKNIIYKCPSDRFCNNYNNVGICEKRMDIKYNYKNQDGSYENLDGENVSKYRDFTYEYEYINNNLLQDLSNNYILDLSNNLLLDLNNNPIKIDKNNPYFDISNNLAYISIYIRNIPISKDGNCGVQYGYKCPIGQCCSENGKCGFNKETCYYPNYNDNVSMINKNIYNNYNALLNFKDKHINDIVNKYTFETSSDGNCGINLKYDKIVKCPENQCCSKQNKCGTGYNFCGNKFDFKYFNIKNLDFNLIHGKNALDNYKKEVTQKLDNDYKNNLFQINDDICGYNYFYNQVFKCSNNNCCVNDKCTNDKEICKNADINSKLHGEQFIPIIPEINQDIKLKTKPEQVPEIKPEQVPEIKPEQVPEIKPEQVPEIKPEQVPEIKPKYNIISLIFLIILILLIISSVIYFIYYIYKKKQKK